VELDYNDPYVPKLYKTRKYNYTRESIELTAENLKKYDLVVLSTDHSDYDYQFIADNSDLIIDTRNAFEKAGVKADHIFKS
jgi:UDP-N-acetyl-D-glucosamine dehydrogenase